MLRRTSAILFAILLTSALTPGHGTGEIRADHGAANEFSALPDSLFGAIRAAYRIFYGHTSHGSQIMTGIEMLAAENTAWSSPTFTEYYGDLGHTGDLGWVQPTRDFLDGHPECNVAIWSWCGGCSDNTEAGIQAYLDAMGGLEAEYPSVHFVYMTGHLDGTGPAGNLYQRNDQIRAWCATHDKVLFDFADIESYDPDGTWYPDEADTCAWCADWCAIHPCPSCGGCAHSHCFNCYRKGEAFWWMMARLLGWSPATRVVSDGVPALVPAVGNRPNPFNPSTEISYTVATGGEIRLAVHDATGRRVALLVRGVMPPGVHLVTWNGRTDAGTPAPAGVYFTRLVTRDGSAAAKMVLLR